MEHGGYSWSWIEAQVAQAGEAWNDCAGRLIPVGPRYSRDEQRKREKAYDQALSAVEREARRTPRNPTGRLLAQRRIVDEFPRFAAIALDLSPEAVQLLTGSFLPVGTQLARRARAFDPGLSMDDIIQACRNAWTACGLQALLGRPMELTSSIFAYSLLYPYSDNCLDYPELSTAEKLRFSERFRQRLRGLRLSACNPREAAVWAMVQIIEEQYPRPSYPQVFDCLLAIHRAQEKSIAQLGGGGRFNNSPHNYIGNYSDNSNDNSCANYLDNMEIERITCLKGGTSVLANACLVQPRLSPEESRFSIDWGVLLQLGDDLQDVGEDLGRGSVTLFTRAAARGEHLDSLVLQLLNFSRRVADSMDRLPHGTGLLKDLLRMSWRSLVLMAVANARQFFSPAFLADLEPSSPFGFDFLRARNERLAGRQALYAILFDAFLEAGPGERSGVPLAGESLPDTNLPPAADLRFLSNSFA
jgi:hypothetical protein